MRSRFVFTAAILTILFIQSNGLAQDDKNELIKQLFQEAHRLGLRIDGSQIDATSLDNDGIVAAVPLITDSTLNVTSEQFKKGDVYTTLQCMRTKILNGCYRARVTDIINGGKELAVSLVDANGNIVATAQVSSIEKHRAKRWAVSIVRGPFRLYIDGAYIGTYSWMIIYQP